ncbi:hypothetical protein BSKO_03846 [Bryopsis sp. KO-2023]|nr:hypothetical protein BSKO_03846 [Bryopsis sp. KO-2023]
MPFGFRVHPTGGIPARERVVDLYRVCLRIAGELGQKTGCRNWLTKQCKQMFFREIEADDRSVFRSMRRDAIRQYTLFVHQNQHLLDETDSRRIILDKLDWRGTFEHSEPGEPDRSDSIYIQADDEEHEESDPETEFRRTR